MYECFNKRQSLIRVLHEDFLDQIFIVFAASLLELDVTFDDFSTDFDLVASERSSAMHKLVEENAEGPDVYLVVVWLRSDHFRRHIF